MSISWSERIASNTALGFGAGTIYGALQTAWSRGAPGATPSAVVSAESAAILAKSSVNFSLIMLVYTGGAAVAGTFRDKDDGINWAFGGVTTGAFIGARYGSIHQAITKSVTLGVLAGVLHFATETTLGGTTDGKRDVDTILEKRFSYAKKD